MYKTLTDPDRCGNFYFFNNGITAVCHKFTHNALQMENWEVHVKGLQIVNGGQTSKTIQKTIDEHPADYSRADVLLRLYELSGDDDGLVNNITFATNSQNPVDLTDLRSNDAMQERLALALKDLGYEYKRKRDDQVAASPDTITSSVAAEAVMTVWRKRPHAAKFRRSKLFSDFYDDVFSADLNAAQLILSVLVFRIVENERKRPRKKRPRFVPYASHFLAMVVGDLLLRSAKTEPQQVDHTNLNRIRAILDAQRARFYDQAVSHLVVVLRRLGISDDTPLQRVAAQFRRGDLLDPLQDVLAKLPRSPTNAGGRAKNPSGSTRARSGSKFRRTSKGRSVSGGPSSFELNEKELAVLQALRLSSSGLRLGELGSRAFPRTDASQSNSWCRNSVRRPLRGGLIEQVSRGTYRIAAAGRRALKSAAGGHKAKAP